MKISLLKAGFVGGVSVPSKYASTARGMWGVGVMVGVLVSDGVFVMVGDNVSLGVRLIVGVKGKVALAVGVGDGGKYL